MKLHILPRSVRKWLWYKSWDASVERAGIWFFFKGDEVCWTWPWRRKGKPKYISLSFSGTGEFGDARFDTLQEIRDAWNDFFIALSKTTKEPITI